MRNNIKYRENLNMQPLNLSYNPAHNMYPYWLSLRSMERVRFEVTKLIMRNDSRPVHQSSH